MKIIPNKVGRPAIVTEDVLRKLEEAFAMGCTDKEACLYANIGQTTFYAYQGDNLEFLKRKDELKETPVLRARTTILNNLKDPDTAKWFLERKKKDEFSSRSELTGKDGEALQIGVVSYADNSPVQI